MALLGDIFLLSGPEAPQVKDRRIKKQEREEVRMINKKYNQIKLLNSKEKIYNIMEEYYSKSNIAGRAWQLPAGSQ